MKTEPQFPLELLRRGRALFGFLLYFCFIGTVSASNNVRATNPNALSVEVGGRGLLYSVNYDRVLSEDLSVGLGYGSYPAYVGASNVSTGSSGQMIPFYLNYYLAREAGSLFLTGGAGYYLADSYSAYSNPTFANLQLGSNRTPLVITAGVGYEYRSDPGFLVRVAGYLMATNNIVPWGGFSFGYSF